MNKPRNVIGILGGMGPQAGVKLVDILISKSAQNGAKENSDFPEIILDSVPVPDFISDTKNLNQVLKTLKRRVKLLSSMNISKVAIACNTAHIMLDDLQSVTEIKFVSIIEEVAKQVKASRLNKVGLMATPSTIRFGLFQQALSKFNLDVVIPTKKEQLILEKVIRNVLSGKKFKGDILQLTLIANSFKRKGAKGIILGCTELPLVFPKKPSIPVFDCLVILADALLRSKRLQGSLRKIEGGNTIKQ